MVSIDLSQCTIQSPLGADRHQHGDPRIHSLVTHGIYLIPEPPPAPGVIRVTNPSLVDIDYAALCLKLIDHKPRIVLSQKEAALGVAKERYFLYWLESSPDVLPQNLADILPAYCYALLQLHVSADLAGVVQSPVAY